MNCHYCGTELSEKDRFCLFCGTKVEPPAVPPPVEPEDFFPEPEANDLEFPLDIRPPEPVSLEYTYPIEPLPEPKPPTKPALRLPTGRALWKMVLLGILTLGIYPVVIWSRLVAELNIAASRYDGERTVSFFGMVLLGIPTLGIYPLVWYDGLCRRIGAELERRGISYTFGPRDFWLWNVLGSLILAGPFVFTQRLMTAMNQINASFNLKG